MSRPSPFAKLPALACASGLALALFSGPLWAAGGGGSPSGSSGGSPGPGARGIRHLALKKYEGALEYIAKAHASEERLATTSPDERSTLEKKTRKYYRKALDKLDSSLRRDPLRHEAHSDRGYVLRKLGDFETALEAYDEALSIAPRYAPAIEYRGEAYLELGRLGEAKDAHTRLMRIDRPLAALLLEKMHAWVGQRDGESNGFEDVPLNEFSDWVAARTASAGQSSTGDETNRW